MFRIPKQKKVSPFLGGLKELFSRVMLYAGIMNFVLISVTAYHTSIRDIIHIPFWVFFLTLVAGLSIAMIFEYIIVLPSSISFSNRQSYKHDNPIREDMCKILMKLDDIEQRIKILENKEWDIEMYTDIEYKAKIKEIEPIAIALVMNFNSKDARIIASKMNSEDSYILGMCIGDLLQVDNRRIFAKCGSPPDEVRKKIDEITANIKSPSLEEIKEETQRLEPLAMKMIMEKHPREAREFASGLDSVDAYILGQHIGGLLEAQYHKTGQDKRKVKTF